MPAAAPPPAPKPATITRRPMFQRSADADTLIRLMENSAVGKIYTYVELCQAIGKPGTKRPSCLQTALNFLHAKHGMVFLAIKGQGIKRASDSEIVQDVRAHLPRRVKSAVKWAGKRLAVVEVKSLDVERRLDYNTAGTFAAIFRQATTVGTTKKIEQSSKEADKPLPLAIALKCVE